LSYSVIGCEPSAEDIVAKRYSQQAGGIGFKADATGDIRFFCIIFNNTSQSNVDWNHFSVSYSDSDGTGNVAQVVGTLRFVAPNGQVKTVATLDSSTDDSTGDQQKTMSGFVTHNFDFANNYYYAQFRITRSNPEHTARVNGLRISFQNPPIPEPRPNPCLEECKRDRDFCTKQGINPKICNNAFDGCIDGCSQ
jgi:hypothetical protein